MRFCSELTVLNAISVPMRRLDSLARSPSAVMSVKGRSNVGWWCSGAPKLDVSSLSLKLCARRGERRGGEGMSLWYVHQRGGGGAAGGAPCADVPACEGARTAWGAGRMVPGGAHARPIATRGRGGKCESARGSG